MKPLDSKMTTKRLRLAVAGGGQRCLLLLKTLEYHNFQHLRIDVAGVVSRYPTLAGFCYAKAKGIFTSTKLEDLWVLPGLDMIVQLTDDPELVLEIQTRKPDSISVLDQTTSQLLYDVLRLSGQLQENQDQADLAHSLSHLLIGACSEGMVLLDRDFRILRANDAACKNAGLTSEEAVGKFCFQVSHGTLSPCHSSDTPCPMRSTLSTGQSAHAIHEHLQQDGSSVFCDVSTYPLLDQDGKVVQVLEVFRDITADLSRRMEARSRALRNDLARMVQEDRLTSLGKLVASVAHEINNPIGSILNFSKLMEKSIAEGRTGPDQMSNYLDWLNMTINEAERVKYTVRNLLSFARQASISQQPVDLADIVQATLGLTAHHLQLAGVSVNAEVPSGSLIVQGDPHQLQQVITNLLLNAMEAMNQDGKLDITGSLSEDRKHVLLELRDNGVGIPPENLEKVFEPFFSTKGASSGTGLGLSVVYGIVRQHKGQIKVTSQPGQGTCFRLCFPAHDGGCSEAGKS